jgi:hypothetical protein
MCDALAGAIIVVLVWPVGVIPEPLGDGAENAVSKVAFAAAHFAKLCVRKAANGFCDVVAHGNRPLA